MLRVFENKISRRIFGPERDENVEWRNLHNEELLSLATTRTSLLQILHMPLNNRNFGNFSFLILKTIMFLHRWEDFS